MSRSKENFRKRSKSPFLINKKSFYGVMEIILSEIKNMFFASFDKKMTKENKVLNYVLKEATKDNPDSVLKVIDSCGYNNFFLMNIGDKKGKILDEYVLKSDAKCLLELGVYLGYSTIRIARNLSEDAHLFSIDVNEEFLNIAKQHLDFSGLTEKVSFYNGKASEVIPQLDQKFDFVFIDHWKEAYLQDLKILIEHDRLNDGAIIFADNIVLFHLEEYLDFVRTSPNFSSEFIPALREYSSSHPDGIEVSHFKK